MSEKRINPRRPIPSQGYDKLRQNLQSGFAEGFPVEEFPSPDNRPNINRGTITTRKDDNVKDGNDPGAPKNPMLKKKIILTSVISFILSILVSVIKNEIL